MKKHLIIAPINENGQILAFGPGEYVNLGPCEEEEFGRRLEVAEDAIRVASQLNALHTENAMRTKQIFDALMYAGIITPQGMKAEPFLKPYFTKFIKEYENNQRFWEKVRKNASDKTKMFWGNLKVLGTGFFVKYGTKATVWFNERKAKNGKR